MLTLKERPHTFDEVIGQKEIVHNLREQSKLEKFFPVYIFGGQFGSGKTTMARILAMAANCKHKDDNGNPCCECDSCRNILSGNSVDVVEMDAASNTGVNDIRSLKETVDFYPVLLKKKVYIIDEVHMLSIGAFNALLKVLEEPPEYTMFILCTTEVRKIPSTVQSRSVRYSFSQIEEKDMTAHLHAVAQKNGIIVEDAGLKLISKNSEGAMRNALSILEQIGSFGAVTENSVANMLGIADPKYLFTLLNLLLNADRAGAIEQINRLLQMGKNAQVMVTDLLDICADCVLASYGSMELIKGTDHYVDSIRKLVVNRTPDVFSNLADGLMDIRVELNRIPGKTTLICGMIRLLSVNGSAIALLSAKIERLEEELRLLKSGSEKLKLTDEGQKIVDVPKIQQANTTMFSCDRKKEEDEQVNFKVPVKMEEVSEEKQKREKNDANIPEEQKSSSIQEDFLRMFGYMYGEDIEQETETESSEEAATIPEGGAQESNAVCLDKIYEEIEHICDVEPNTPFLRNILAYSCTKLESECGVIFETSKPSVYGILQKYATMYELPFSYALVEEQL